LVAVGIVVIFAYLLGIVFLLLDIVYVIVDPRVHIISSENTVQISRHSPVSGWNAIAKWLKDRRSHHPPSQPLVTTERKDKSDKSWVTRFSEQSRLVSKNIKSGLRFFFRELKRYPSAIFGLTIILLLVIGSVYAVVVYPYEQIGSLWETDRLRGRVSVPRLAEPAWTNIFRSEKYLSVESYDETQPSVTRTVEILSNGWTDLIVTYTFDYAYGDFPQEVLLYIDSEFVEKRPFISVKWITPDGREIKLKDISTSAQTMYDFDENIPVQRLVSENPNWQEWFNFGKVGTTPSFYVLFADPYADEPRPLQGTYQLQMGALLFEENSDVSSELLLLGHVYGAAGTDFLRRELIVPLLWGMPFALIFGLAGAFTTTILAMIISAAGVWFGGWVDNVIQRLTEVNMVLPVLAVGVLAYALFGIDIWVILAVIILMNVFGSPAKTFRSAFLQVKEAPYIEAARAYGASNSRIIMSYLVPRIIPVLVPQLVTLIPSFVFLEATLGLFNIKSDYPTWGRIIYQGLANGALYGSRFWVLEPIALLLLTGLAFAMLGVALERILNPRLLEK